MPAANLCSGYLNRTKYKVAKSYKGHLNSEKSTIVIVHKWQLLNLGIIPKKPQKA
jgi:hypothetical protein